MDTVVILNNIRSNENVGSIFRTADAAGVSHIVLVGYTPGPFDRFGRENRALTKAALGAEKTISWRQVSNLGEAVDALKKDGYEIVAVEQSDVSEDYKKAVYKQKTVFVFGNEVDGLSKEDVELCDRVVELPMKGKKESLNVAVCAGVVLFNT